jgi:hypothetical protein
VTVPLASDHSTRRRWALIAVLVSTILVIVACCGAWIADHGQSDRQAQQTRLAARDALILYLQRVQHGDDQAAYALLCIDVLASYSEPDHARFLSEQPAFTAFSLGDPTGTTGMDGTFLTFPVRFTYPDGTQLTSAFEVGLQTNGPKICDGRGWRH